MLKKPCPYHKGPTKHTLEEYTMMQCYFSWDDQPKEEAKKKATNAQEGNGKDEGFPEVKNCFMIFGGRQRNANAERSTRQSLPPRRSSIGSRKPSRLAKMTTRSTSRT
jgi:hypothetical protein